MLEYYRKEKRIRVHILHELFDEKLQIMRDTFQNVKYNNGVSFNHFLSIMEQYDPDLTQTEAATMYRFAWVLGNN